MVLNKPLLSVQHFAFFKKTNNIYNEIHLKYKII